MVCGITMRAASPCGKSAAGMAYSTRSPVRGSSPPAQNCSFTDQYTVSPRQKMLLMAWFTLLGSCCTSPVERFTAPSPVLYLYTPSWKISRSLSAQRSGT